MHGENGARASVAPIWLVCLECTSDSRIKIRSLWLKLLFIMVSRLVQGLGEETATLIHCRMSMVKSDHESPPVVFTTRTSAYLRFFGLV